MQDTFVAQVQRVGVGAPGQPSIMMPGQGAVIFDEASFVLRDENATLATDDRGGTMTGLTRVTLQPRLATGGVHVPLYVGGGAPNPSLGIAWQIVASAGVPLLAALDIIGAQDLLPGCTSVIFRAVFSGGHLDLLDDSGFEVAGSLLTNTSTNLLQVTADVSGTYAGTGVNTILHPAIVRAWCPGTTVAAGSNGQTLPQSTIHVASVTQLLAGPGVVQIGADTVTYTSVTGGATPTLNGCSGGTHTLSTGEAVTQGSVLLAKAELLLS